MIFDRTKSDVESAKEIRAKKVQKFAELTEDDIAILERGTLTINTLNRIENKQIELADLLNSIGYWNTKIENKNWDYSDIFDENNFLRILNNLSILKSAFFVFKNTPYIPQISFHFSKINDIEKILYDIQSMIDDVKGRCRECGNFECGEE